MSKIFGVFCIILSILLGGCGTTSQRPAGYTYDQTGSPRGYLIPIGENARDQLKWVDREEERYCSRSARTMNTVVGAVIGATVGAVIGGRSSRAPGAALGGLGGGVVGSMSVGEYCATLQTTRGLIQGEIKQYQAARQPMSVCTNRRVTENGRTFEVTDCASSTGMRPGYQNYPPRR